MASAGIWASSFQDSFPFLSIFFNRPVKQGVILTRPPTHRDAPFTLKGRSKRNAEAYVGWYVEGLTEARTLRCEASRRIGADG